MILKKTICRKKLFSLVVLFKQEVPDKILYLAIFITFNLWSVLMLLQSERAKSSFLALATSVRRTNISHQSLIN